MSDADDKSLDDDVQSADAILGRRGGGKLPWTLLVLVLLGGGGAGAYLFRDYDAMRVSYEASSYRARTDHERVEAAERTARAADAQAETARTTLETERRTWRDERATLTAERDRLRASAGLRAAGSVPGGEAVLVSLRQVLTAGSGDARDDGGALRVSLPARVLFGPTGATLSASGGALLDRIAAAIHAPAGTSLEVRAYGDATATRGASPWDAAAMRTVAVARRLVERDHLEPAQIVAIAPAASGTPGGEPHVELVLSATPPATTTTASPVAQR